MRRILLPLLLFLAAFRPLHAAPWGQSWFPIGPAPTSGLFPGGEGGRATVVAVNPSNGFDVWLGTAGGGVWHTTNADPDPGSAWTWYPTSDQEASLAIGALALADCDAGGCTRIYAGTGENAIRRDTYAGQGLLVGSYAGCAGCAGIVSWTRHDHGTSLDGSVKWDFRNASINDLVLDRTTTGPNPETQVLYLTLSSGVTASASETTMTAPEPLAGSAKAGYGLYKSTNNGTNWDYVTVPGAEGAKPTDLEIDPSPAHHDTLYAAFLGRGIFKSTDGGASWCPLNPGIPRPSTCSMSDGLHLPDPATGFDHVELAMDPGDRLHLYASFGQCSYRLTRECTPSIYETFDGGAYWYVRYVGVDQERDAACPAVYSRYTHGLTIPPGHPERLFLGGVQLCYSTNRGTEGSWFRGNASTQPKTPSWEVIHFDHRDIVFDAVGLHALTVSDGGLYSSVDQGFTWTARNDGLQVIAFQSVGIASRTSRIFGGTQDNTAMLWTGSRVWETQHCCGDAGYAVVDEDADNLFTTTNNAATSVALRRRINGGPWQAIPSDLSNLQMQGEPSSIFYPPLVQSPAPTPNQSPTQHALYYGTRGLWRSDDDATSWTSVSPEVLCDGPAQPEIAAGVDVVSAIAVAPSDPDRIYVGCYGGKVWFTNAACGLPSCWTEMSLGLPGTPITWLAVDPLDKNVVYATVSGFALGSHVYGKTPSLFHWIQAKSIAAFNGVPANTIAVESHGPSQPAPLWLGTDKGVYRSPDGGSSWARYGNGLPNVPVYQIGLDEGRRRVVAGTHGRGAFLLSGPTLQSLNDCRAIYGEDLPVVGSGFAPNASCSLRLIREHGTVCGKPPFTTDADGALLRTDAQGQLVTSKGGMYDGKPAAMACHGGKCSGGSSLSDCNRVLDRLAGVEVTCGSQVAFLQIPGCPSVINPPSDWFTLTGLGSPGLGAPHDPEVPGGGSFDFLPTLQASDGSSRVLCSVTVPYAPTDLASDVLQRARDTVNASGACQLAGVSAVFSPPVAVEGEDPFRQPGTLTLTAPALAGAQLVGAIDAPAGQAPGLCFDLRSLALPLQDQVRRMRVRIGAPGGAMGGSITLTEGSSLGDCAVTIQTSSGQAAAGIASALAAGFLAPEIPLATPQCPPGHDPRDLRQEGDALVLGLASALTLCLNDPGVGVAITPADACLSDADCNDGNPCTHDHCLAANGQCQHTPEPNGLPCEDGNACTLGSTCVAGTCGTPVSCGDGNACSQDVCDPTSGACSHPPVQCSDGNPCTADLCNVDTGGCLFTPLTGQRCDDGDPCTAGDACVQVVAGAPPVCQGAPACGDGNPCTDDVCDPATGTCAHPPVQCDDGNPCTFDFCDETGSCNSVAGPGGGGPCDDGNPCTTGDTCIGGGCQGQPISCADKSSCTEDACDPADGSCAHRAAALADVVGLLFTSKTRMTWPPTPGALSWNTYRGTFPGGFYGQTCIELGDALGDGAQVTTDTQSPASGTGFYYLVSEVEGCGEGPLGRDVNGTPIPNASPCPVP